jgi:hypothetical protein
LDTNTVGTTSGTTTGKKGVGIAIGTTTTMISGLVSAFRWCLAWDMA